MNFREKRLGLVRSKGDGSKKRFLDRETRKTETGWLFLCLRRGKVWQFLKVRAWNHAGNSISNTINNSSLIFLRKKNYSGHTEEGNQSG